MKRQWKGVWFIWVLTALLPLAWGAPEDRFKGGSNDGCGSNCVLDKPVSVPAGTMIVIR